MKAYQQLTDNSTNFTLLQEAYKLAVTLRLRSVAEKLAAQIEGLTDAQRSAASDTARVQYAFARVNEALYEGDGYVEALRILDEMKAQTPSIAASGTWNVLRAAALGQQFAARQKKGESIADLQETVDQAIAAISAGMVKYADWLRYLADPDHPTKKSGAVEDRDDDLVSLARSVPEVRKALRLT